MNIRKIKLRHKRRKHRPQLYFELKWAHERAVNAFVDGVCDYREAQDALINEMKDAVIRDAARCMVKTILRRLPQSHPDIFGRRRQS